MRRLVCGKGYTDTLTISNSGKRLKSYKVWCSMLRRCYDPKYHNAKQQTYINCTVCEEWLTFSNFKSWFDVTYIEDFDIDKDILQENVKNKKYSPQTCLFVPQALNLFLTNKRINNKSGYTGIHWNKQNSKWQVQIRVYNHTTKRSRNKHLGLFNSIEDAHIVYINARITEATKWKNIMINDYGWSTKLADSIK